MAKYAEHIKEKFLTTYEAVKDLADNLTPDLIDKYKEEHGALAKLAVEVIKTGQAELDKEGENLLLDIDGEKFKLNYDAVKMTMSKEERDMFLDEFEKANETKVETIIGGYPNMNAGSEYGDMFGMNMGNGMNPFTAMLAVVNQANTQKELQWYLEKDRLYSKIDSLSEANQLLKDNINKNDLVIGSLQDKIAELKESLESASSKEELANLEKQIAELNKVVARESERAAEAEEKAVAQTERADRANERSKQFEERCKKAESRANEREAEANKLRERLKENEKATETVQQKENEIKTLTSKVESKDGEIKALNSKVELLNESVRKLKEEKALLEKESQNSITRYSDEIAQKMDAIEAQLVNKDNAISELTKKNQGLEDYVRQLDEENEKLKSNITISKGAPDFSGVKGQNEFEREWLQDGDTRGKSLGILSINKMKDINRKFGHKAGDEAIKLVAQTLKESFPAADIYRVYGDQFAVIDNYSNSDRNREVLHSIKNKLSAPDIRIETSFGLSGGAEAKSCYDMFETAVSEAERGKYADRAGISFRETSSQKMPAVTPNELLNFGADEEPKQAPKRELVEVDVDAMLRNDIEI